ncbi:MAG TPA: ABC transporter substrate-binding protein [Candidatus Cloacimonadota bacterium]|nr:ABC transporter substrate-binding protein [Candidatus Cloacimonadota bacterium]
MKKYIIILAVLLLTFTACKRAPQTTDEVVITLDWTPNTNHAGLYVAQALGYFTEAGLTVKIEQPGQAITDQIVATGKSHFGVSYQENVIRARSEGLPLVSIAAVIQHNTSGFAALKEAGIKTPKDFEGKRYGSWDSPSEIAILKHIMQSSGADFGKVNIISGIYDFFSTIGKDADFEWIYYGWDGVEAQRRGIDLVYLPLRELNPIFDYYTPVIISSEKYLQDNQDTARRFIAAVSKGYEYCIQEPQKAAEILMNQVPELNKEQVLVSMVYLSNEFKSDASVWGFQKSEVWHSFANWMSDEKLIPKTIDIKTAYTNEYLP